MSKSSDRAGIKVLIHFVIMCLLMYIMATIKPIAPLTPAGMHMLGILLGCIYGWMTIGLVVPSLVGILVMGFNELVGSTAAIAGSFGNPTVAMMLLLFCLIQLIQDEKVSDFIATWSLSRKFIQGKPMLYSWIVLMVACVLGMVNVFLSIFVLWKILYDLFAKLGYQKGEAYSTIMLIGTVMFSMMGLIMFPFVDNGLIIMSAYAGIVGTPIPYVGYFLVVFPTTMVMALVWLLVGKWVFRMDMSKLKDVDSSILDLSLLNLSKRQKASITMLILFIVTILAQALIPQSVPILGYLSKTSIYVVMVVIITVGSLWHIDGKPLMDFRVLMSRGVVWDTWMLTAFVLLLTSYLTSAETGLTAFCVMRLQPLLGGASLYMMVVIVMIFAFLVTNIANNIVVTLCVIPLMFAFSQSMGFAIEPVALVIMMASHLALLTPAASGPAAVMFGNTTWISKGEIYKYVPILLVAMLIVDLTIGYAWANVIF